ncbi:MAG: mucoidy inhibitor MuiA family protein [Sandaracinaceae bacterium]
MTALPIVEVTLLEDRARVRRRGAIDAGVDRLEIEGVAPALVDKTLRGVVVEGEGSIRALSARRARILDPEAREPRIRGLQVAIEAALDELRRLAMERWRADEQVRLTHASASLLVGEIVEDTAWARTDPAAWSRSLRELAERRRTAEEGERRLSRRIERDVAELRRRLAHLESLRRPSHRLACHLEVAVDGDGPRTVEVSYVVPGACWRPAHRATLSDAGHLTWQAEGCIWQNTGEDWDDVEVRLSTERASLGASPPELSTDRLAIQRRAEQVHVERREQRIERTGVAGSAGSPEVPGIDDGGDVLELRAKGRASIPSDGRPHRVPLFGAETDADRQLVSMPELAEAVVLRTTQVHRGEHPLLAGPVDLIRSSGFTGRTSILYVAPGETFELGWGPEGSLRVHRQVEEEAIERGLLSSWRGVRRTVVDRLSNLGPRPLTVEVAERVPVSEIDKVQIEVDTRAIEPPAEPDPDGIVRWRLEVPAHGRGEVKLRYALKHHPDVQGLS